MPRAGINNEPGVHLLTFSCEKRLPLFVDKTLFTQFLHQVHYVRNKGLFRLIAYVIMPNHVHLIVDTATPIDRILSAIKQPFSRKALPYFRNHHPEVYAELLRCEGRSSPARFWLWGGGHDRLILSPSQIENSIVYLHNNPVRAGLVELPEHWPWSSYWGWNDGGSPPIPVNLIEW